MQINDWLKRLSSAQRAHYALSERYSFVNSAVGIPLVILTTVTGAFTFFNSQDAMIDLVIRYSSLLAACLASILAFGQPLQKYEHHRKSAAKYGALKRKIESQLLKSNGDDISDEFYDCILEDWNSIAEDAHVTKLSLLEKLRVRGN